MAAIPDFGSLQRLIGASGAVPDGPACERVDAALAELAIQEGLGPLLGARLHAGLLAADPATRQRLIHAHRQCLASELVADQARAPILAALTARAIDHVILKGAALQRLGAYPREGSRPMCDLDVLVPRERWGDALAAVRATAATLIWPEGRSLTERVYHEAHVLAGRGMVDLHRALAAWPLFDVDHDGVIARATRQADGSSLPDPVDLFVHLAIHAACDGFALSLRSVVDGLLSIAVLRPDPAAVVARALAWKARTATAVYLTILGRFGLSEPAWRSAAATLRATPAVNEIAAQALTGAATAPRFPALQRHRKLARAIDGHVRPLLFFTYRGTLRVGDALWHMVAR